MFVKTYLTAYNVVAATGWIYLVGLIVKSILTETDGGSIPSKIYMYRVTMAVQTVAILEILHSALRLVKSPVFTTALQVVSRCAVIDFLGRPHQLAIVQQPTFYPLLLAWYASFLR